MMRAQYPLAIPVRGFKRKLFDSQTADLNARNIVESGCGGDHKKFHADLDGIGGGILLKQCNLLHAVPIARAITGSVRQRLYRGRSGIIPAVTMAVAMRMRMRPRLNCEGMATAAARRKLPHRAATQRRAKPGGCDEIRGKAKTGHG